MTFTRAWLAITLAIIAAMIALAIIRALAPRPLPSPWEVWESCVLNGNYDPSQATAHCGPQPVP